MIRILKSKPSLWSTIESASYQLVQRCFAGGTPKGKAKLKVTGPLKRSKITIRKGGAATAGKGAAKVSGEKQKLEQLYDRCLNAPTPVRHLAPKARAREVERAKLGLISKDRQREIDIIKKGKERLGVSEKPGIIGTPGLDLITLGVVDAELIPKYDLTAEDGKRLAKEYSRVLMRQHRERQAAESAVLEMRKAAIEALPEGLKAAALMADTNPVPPNRYVATITPPIEGFMEKMRDAAMTSGGRQKLR